MLLLKPFTTITLPLNRYFISIKKICNNSVPLTHHQNMDKEIQKNCFGPLKKGEGKAKKRKKKKTSFTVRTATEKQPQHFGWHQAALLKCPAAVTFYARTPDSTHTRFR
jgi:hypothetical protein